MVSAFSLASTQGVRYDLMSFPGLNWHGHVLHTQADPAESKPTGENNDELENTRSSGQNQPISSQ